MRSLPKYGSCLVYGLAVAGWLGAVVPMTWGSTSDTADSLIVIGNSGHAGETVQVSIHLVNSISIAGVSLFVLYDDFAIMPTSVQPTPDLSPLNRWAVDTSQAGVVRVLAFSSSPFSRYLLAGRWQAFVITFQILLGAPTGIAGVVLDNSLGPQNAFSDTSGLRLVIPALVSDVVTVLPTTSVAEDDFPVEMPKVLNYPNPFNTSTNINCSAEAGNSVVVTIYDLLGRLIWQDQRNCRAGESVAFTWNGVDWARQPVVSGQYYYSITVDGLPSRCGKLLLLR